MVHPSDHLFMFSLEWLEDPVKDSQCSRKRLFKKIWSGGRGENVSARLTGLKFPVGIKLSLNKDFALEFFSPEPIKGGRRFKPSFGDINSILSRPPKGREEIFSDPFKLQKIQEIIFWSPEGRKKKN